jgi:uncharacterized protein YdeI (YjbR/CyaY-like superfamily)
VPPELPVRAFRSGAAWDSWLTKNHERSNGVIVKVAKKGSGKPSATLPELLRIAISYGWIDGIRKALDDEWFLQKYSPRRPQSNWSQINCTTAIDLIDRGEMKPAGLREVERAKTDGRWEAASPPPSKAEVPADLAKALKKNAKARTFFATLDSQNRYSILYRLHSAKKPETRARRLEQFVSMLAKGEKLYP